MEVSNEYFEEEKLLELLCKDINAIPVLSKEEEYSIAKAVQGDDRGAMDRLVESNIKFVMKTVFEYWRPGLPLMDMISEGCLGLMVAIKTFNPDLGFRFLTYAAYQIKWRIMNIIKDFRKHEHDSLDVPAYEDDDGITLKDLLVSEEPLSDEKCFYSEMEGSVRDLLSFLNDRERKVIGLRFWHNKTLDEIGSVINLSGERTRQIEARSLNKLKRMIRRQKSNVSDIEKFQMNFDNTLTGS